MWSRPDRWELYDHLPPVLVMSHRTFDVDKTRFVSGPGLSSPSEQTALLWLYPSHLFQSAVVQTAATLPAAADAAGCTPRKSGDTERQANLQQPLSPFLFFFFPSPSLHLPRLESFGETAGGDRVRRVSVCSDSLLSADKGGREARMKEADLKV